MADNKFASTQFTKTVKSDNVVGSKLLPYVGATNAPITPKYSQPNVPAPKNALKAITTG